MIPYVIIKMDFSAVSRDQERIRLNKSNQMDFKDSNLVCTSLFEVGPEALRESTTIYPRLLIVIS